MPLFESQAEATEFLCGIEEAYTVNRRWLEQLHKATATVKNITAGSAVFDLLTEEEQSKMLEYTTYDALHELLRHVSVQCKKLKTLCDEVDLWIIEDCEITKDFEEHGTLQDSAKFYYNHRGDRF